MINPDWTKWIWASINTHFNDRKQTLVMRFEPQDEIQECVEVKINGPIFLAINNGYYTIRVQIFAMIQAVVDRTGEYKLQKQMGIVGSIFTNTIELKKYGDDESSLGCFFLKDQIETNYFGIKDEVEQALVEAEYEIELRGQ